MSLKPAFNALMLLFLSVAILSCKEDNSGISEGNLSFTLSVTTGGTNGRTVESASPKAILLSVKDSDGLYIFNQQKFPIYKIGDEYLTENLQFNIGSYTIEDFIVLDSVDSAIYLTPKTGSEFEELVSSPLPIHFTINSNEVTEILIDVIPADLGDVSQFGYATISFNVVHVAVIQPDSIAGKDAIIGSFIPDTNFGEREDIHLYAWTQGGELNIHRVVMDFQFSNLPSGSIIDSAFLSLHFNTTSKYLDALSLDGHSGENSFTIEKITQAWHEENVTWNNQPTTTAVGKITVPASESITMDYKINVSNIITDLYENPESGFGLMLKHEVEEPYKVTFLASSDHPNPALRPKLTIYYH
ncbi:MAG: DNRLRE domain-containing protein [Marinoscillum sp.]|uniref:DNRLRE domain-containing protein n=1 Tax=Marinoscillum sp. TaxID=2024838 RepID=UPI0032F764F0